MLTILFRVIRCDSIAFYSLIISIDFNSSSLVPLSNFYHSQYSTTNFLPSFYSPPNFSLNCYLFMLNFVVFLLFRNFHSLIFCFKLINCLFSIAVFSWRLRWLNLPLNFFTFYLSRWLDFRRTYPA